MGVQKIGNKNWREIVKLYLDSIRLDLRLEEEVMMDAFLAPRDKGNIPIIFLINGSPEVRDKNWRKNKNWREKVKH
jgi:hypothetical protein